MFSRISTTFFCAFFAFALLAAATPNPVVKRWEVPTTKPAVTKTITVTAPASTVTSAGQCNTGSLQCCQSTQSASSASAQTLLGLLGISLSSLTGLIGSGCSPITAIGLGSGSACSAKPVCCSNNSVGGLISVGCVPVSL